MEAAGDEARRMAPYVVGPWEVDGALVDLDFVAAAPLAVAFNAGVALSYPFVSDAFAQHLTDVTEAQGFIAGLTTGRTGTGDAKRLQNAVLRFADADAARAATRELSAVTADNALRPVSFSPAPTSDLKFLTSPWQPGACADFASSSAHPDAATSASLGDRSVVRSFTAHGAYVLYQFVVAKSLNTACMTVMQLLAIQEPRIDQFVPTDPAKLGDLPQDPSGQLAAKTLSGAAARTAFSGGAWQPDGLLHFERAKPNDVQAWLTSAGVDWVSQALTRVYEARDAAAAGQLADRFVANTQASENVRPTDPGVPGLPKAKCLDRPQWQRYTSAMMVANTSVYWHFSCIATAGRYAFMAYSDQEQDVKQQISAQYRILAGE